MNWMGKAYLLVIVHDMCICKAGIVAFGLFQIHNSSDLCPNEEQNSPAGYWGDPLNTVFCGRELEPLLLQRGLDTWPPAKRNMCSARGGRPVVCCWQAVWPCGVFGWRVIYSIEFSSQVMTGTQEMAFHTSVLSLWDPLALREVQIFALYTSNKNTCQ